MKFQCARNLRGQTNAENTTILDNIIISFPRFCSIVILFYISEVTLGEQFLALIATGYTYVPSHMRTGEKY